MKILRQKLFSRKSHREYIEREQERNKELDKLVKEASPRTAAQADIMYNDTDSAGKARYGRNQMKSGLVGAGVGAVGGKLAKEHVKKLAESKRPTKGVVIAGSAIIGSKVAKAATHRRNERVKDEIFEKGDKELLAYLKSSPKEQRKIEEDYIPIGWRVDKKGNYLKEKDYYPYDKSRNKARLDAQESEVRINRGVQREVDKENRRRERKKK